MIEYEYSPTTPNPYSALSESRARSSCTYMHSDLALPSLQSYNWFLSMPPHLMPFNPVPNDWSKLKAFADDNLYVAQVMIYVFDRLKNIMGKRENAGYQNVFKSSLSQGC